MNSNNPHPTHLHTEDVPPYSRIFVVCDKRLRENDLRSAFERFGTIDNLFIPKKKHGIAFIQYDKTSSAALAIQEMNLKSIDDDTKPLKVMLASEKSDGSTQKSAMPPGGFTRLFIKVPKEETVEVIKEHFKSFGRVDSVYVQRDKVTSESKGFAYINYDTFLNAAKAFEECDRKYKPIFAAPREGLKRNIKELNCSHGNGGRSKSPPRHFGDDDITSLISTESQSYNSISVSCSPFLAQKHIEDLFNLVPGMNLCQYSVDNYNGICRAVITYETEKAAAYAVEKLNQFEFPSGEILTVKPNDNPLAKVANNLTDILNTFKDGIDSSNPNLTILADAIAKASTLIREVASSKSEKKEQRKYHINVDLPPVKPLASNDSTVAKRLFVVCKPFPPPVAVLEDVFCRFGHLMHIATFPLKTFGFVKYASIESALEAIKVLNGAIIDGVHFKVMEAEEKTCKDDFNMSCDSEIESEDHNTVRKKMKLMES